MVNRIRFGSDVNGDCFLICLEKSELFILALTKSRVYKTLNIRVVYLKTRERINLTLSLSKKEWVCDVRSLHCRWSTFSGGAAPFTDIRPSDHGARFSFSFGFLEAGELIQFNIYYGAVETEGAAEEALASVSAEVYSFGKSFSGGTCSGKSSLRLKYTLCPFPR